MKYNTIHLKKNYIHLELQKAYIYNRTLTSRLLMNCDLNIWLSFRAQRMESFHWKLFIVKMKENYC